MNMENKAWFGHKSIKDLWLTIVCVNRAASVVVQGVQIFPSSGDGTGRRYEAERDIYNKVSASYMLLKI